jgi:hypothetical protein
MSYLRGPLTKTQVSQLMEGRKQGVSTATADLPPTPVESQAAAATAPPPAEEKPVLPEGFSAIAPALGTDVPQVFLPLDLHEREATRQLSQDSGRQLDVERIQLVYEPGLIGAAEIRFVDRKRKINEQLEKVLLMSPPIDAQRSDWGDAATLPIGYGDLLDDPEEAGEDQGPFFAPVPEDANSAREIKSINKKLADWLYYNSKHIINVHQDLGLFQHPDESPRAFKIRLQQAAREERDVEVDKLEQNYEKQIDRLETKLRKEERELAEDEADYSARKQAEMVGIGESVVGFFMGRRSTRAVSSAMSKRRMTAKALQDIEESKDVIEDLEADIQELEEELQEETRDITAKWADLLDNVTTEEITPRRTDVHVETVALAWLPAWLVTYHDGRRSRVDAVPAYALPEE